MLVVANEGGVEIAEGLLEPRRAGIEGLVLGKARALFAKSYEEAGQGFEVRGKINGDLAIVSVCLSMT